LAIRNLILVFYAQHALPLKQSVVIEHR
jgi:hypothetical protein